MTIGGVSNGSNLRTQNPMASGSENVAQLEQQKKALQEELKRVKEDDKLQPDAKKKKIDELEKKIDELQKKIQKIEKAIQKASVDKTKNVQAPNSSASEKIDELSDPESSKGFLQNLGTKEQIEQMRKNKSGEVGSLLDIDA